MCQQKATHVHGDMVAEQNNIDVVVVEQELINIAEIHPGITFHDQQ